MKRLLTLCFALTFSVAFAGPNKKPNPSPAKVDWSTWPQAEYPYAAPKELPKDKAATKRKLAADMTFSESDLSDSMKGFRTKMNAVKTGDDLAKLLAESSKPENYATYHDDLKFFLGTLQLAIPMRGIVWKMRPLFETTGIGNKATHGQAVQFVRNIVTTSKIMSTSDQSQAAIEYFTQPVAGMTQFQNMMDFQKFLVVDYVMALQEATRNIRFLYEKDPNKVYAWDNKIGFGKGVFDDGLNRFVGVGKAEKEITIAALQQGIHDAYVFSAYNQNYLIEYFGDVSENFGFDTIPGAGYFRDFGITAKERHDISDKLIAKGWLKIHPNVGELYLKNAYNALLSSVDYSVKAYDTLQGASASTTMAINPFMFQPNNNRFVETAIKNLQAVVKGNTTVRSPVDGETVEVNIKNFYLKPLPSLAVLRPTNFETTGNLENKTAAGQKYRNYTHGRSTGWNNSDNGWASLVPSAKGQPANYMEKARRVINTSRGVNGTFGMIDMFVQ